MIMQSGRTPTPPGEWEIEEGTGKRFRWNGRFIEYEPTILTSHGTFTERQLANVNARQRAELPKVPVKTPPIRLCPFKQGIHPGCTREKCAWYDGGKCAQVCPHPTTGKKCPYSNSTCTANCAMRVE